MFCLVVLQVQRSLVGSLHYAVQPKASQPVPALSRALARVLCATESKENKTETEDPDKGSGDYAENNTTTGEIHRQHLVWTTFVISASVPSAFTCVFSQYPFRGDLTHD